MTTRRRFLGALATPFLMPATQGLSRHPVLSTLEPATSGARHVRIHETRIPEVAFWMGHESLPWPDFRFPMIPDGDDADAMDFIFLTAAINFAFTDFERHVTFTTRFAGQERSDSDAMMACLKRAYDDGVRILDARYLASVDRSTLGEIFRGNIEMPMLDERVAIFREIGEALGARGQRFHEFLREGPRSTAAALDRLEEAFPSFRDESPYRGATVRFSKRSQLLLWQLHARFREGGYFSLEDPEQLTVFADYIVPVALRVLGIVAYSEELESAIQDRRLLPRHGEQEVEIRASSIWACHLLTNAINGLRPVGRQVIPPVVDTRLWTHYHESHWPHHLTVTTAY